MAGRKKFRKQTQYVSILTVHLKMARDAYDMMRYDRCFPATEDDSRKLWALDHGRSKPSDHVVKFVRVSHLPKGATTERWASFGASVLDERSPDEPPFELADVDAGRLLSP